MCIFISKTELWKNTAPARRSCLLAHVEPFFHFQNSVGDQIDIRQIDDYLVIIISSTSQVFIKRPPVHQAPPTCDCSTRRSSIICWGRGFLATDFYGLTLWVVGCMSLISLRGITCLSIFGFETKMWKILEPERFTKLRDFPVGQPQSIWMWLKVLVLAMKNHR